MQDNGRATIVVFPFKEPRVKMYTKTVVLLFEHNRRGIRTVAALPDDLSSVHLVNVVPSDPTFTQRSLLQVLLLHRHILMKRQMTLGLLSDWSLWHRRMQWKQN